jgi:eukaryotic-like serine/threonine-protein kinase
MSFAKRTLAPTRVAGQPALPVQESGVHPDVGTILAGKYHLDRILGSGGMAVVFAATHRNQKQLAIKMLKPELAGLPDVRMRFLQEGYAANSVRHPGTVSVLDDAVSEDGCPFLVMELLEGLDAQACLKAAPEPFPVEAVLALGYQLLDVLAAAHDREILHRDIKPANLLLTTDGTLKVLDFGIARVRAAIQSERDRQMHKVTVEGLAIGTPAFMAPEQASGLSSEVDGRADIWSAAATLFTCLSRKFVHEGHGIELLGLARTAQARPLASVAPDVPPRVAQIIDRALSFQSERRWPSAAAMRDAIAATYQELYGKPVSPAPLGELLRARSAGPVDRPDASNSHVDASTVPRPSRDLDVPAPTASDALTEVASAAGTAAKPVVRDETALPTNGRTRWVAVTAALVCATFILAVAWIGVRRATSSRSIGQRATPASSDVPESISVAGSGAPAPRVSASPPASAQPDQAASTIPSPPPPSAVASPPPPSAVASVRPPHPKPTGPVVSPGARPCRLVSTVDQHGETHFSCPCELSRCRP